ncbi:MAG: hypothetical protein P4L76_05510 [Beijerinckiaceae bacterium]|nr:hypothetical protein [Beijerinckiaceae bacterium]
MSFKNQAEARFERKASRRDCDLTIENWNLFTFHGPSGPVKQWHPRGAALASSPGRPELGWRHLNARGAPLTLMACCETPVGNIQSCSIDDSLMGLRDWVSLPFRTGAGEQFSWIVFMADEGAVDLGNVGTLVIRTDQSRIELEHLPLAEEVDDLEPELRTALLLLAAGCALARDGQASNAWARFAAAFGLAGILETLPPLRAQIAITPQTIQVRGVIGQPAWPLALIMVDHDLELLRPLSLQTTEIDSEGGVLFRLSAKLSNPACAAPGSLLMLATDGLYRIVPA